MSRKKPKYVKKLFESDGSASDTSANIYQSMMESPAWMELSAKQKVLYLACKSRYYGEKAKPNDDNLCFTMNRYVWAEKLQLYPKTNGRDFYRDMAALIEHGFVICVRRGANLQKKNFYRFSDAWQRYGTADFSISPDCMTMTMLHQRMEDKKA